MDGFSRLGLNPAANAPHRHVRQSRPRAISPSCSRGPPRRAKPQPKPKSPANVPCSAALEKAETGFSRKKPTKSRRGEPSAIQRNGQAVWRAAPPFGRSPLGSAAQGRIAALSSPVKRWRNATPSVVEGCASEPTAAWEFRFNRVARRRAPAPAGLVERGRFTSGFEIEAAARGTIWWPVRALVSGSRRR